MYFYVHNEEVAKQLSEHPRARPFERGYLDSDTYLHCMRDTNACTFHQGMAHSRAERDTFENIEYKIFLSGLLIPLGGRRIYVLDSPWKAIVEVIDGHPRKDLVPYKGKLPEYFYRKKIGIFGGPGSGKSCLARSMTNFLSIRMGIHADNCYEYATTHIARYGPPDFADQVGLFIQQFRREEEISDHKQVCISDCPSPLGYIYVRELVKNQEQGTHHSILWMHDLALRALDSFDCKVFLPFKAERVKEDGIRLHNPLQSKVISEKIRGFLEETGSEYIDGDESSEGLIRRLFLLNDSIPCTD